jgi:hypothetical protein
VPRVGGVKAIDAHRLNDDRLSFINTERVGKWEQVKYDLVLRGGRMEGTATREWRLPSLSPTAATAEVHCCT